MATIDLSGVPAVVTITNISDHVKAVQFYRNSAVISLSPADLIKIKVESSAELAHYMQLANEELTVASAAE